MNDATNWFDLLYLAANGGALLVHLTIKATLLLLVMSAVIRLLRRSSAAVKHTLWLACFLGLLLLPILTFALPSWHPLGANSPASSLSEPLRLGLAASAEPSSGEKTSSLLVRTIATGRSDFVPVVSTAQWILAVTSVCWLLGAVLGIRKLALGFVAAKRLQSRGYLVGDDRLQDDSLQDEFRQCMASLNLQASVFKALPRLILVHDEALPVPLTWGCWRPVVLMPVTSAQWSTSCRRAALLHELAHIQRWDWFVQSLASLTCLLFWFHPLVWFAAQSLRLESERATDDHVLASGLKATDYSSSLLEIVRFVASNRENERQQNVKQKDSLMKFAVPMSGTSKIETRLHSLLDPKQSRSVVTKKLRVAISLVALAAVVPLATAKEPAGAAEEPAKSQSNLSSALVINRSELHVVNPLPEDLIPEAKDIVTGFKFIGNTLLSSAELQKLLVSKIGAVSSDADMLADGRAIYNAYIAIGFPRLSLVMSQERGVITYELFERKISTSRQEGLVDVPISIRRRSKVINPLHDTPSPQAKDVVTGFKFSGNTLLTSAELQAALVSKIGAISSRNDIAADADAINKTYASKGFAGLLLDISQEKGVITYKVIEAKISQIKLEGLVAIKPTVIEKLITVSANDIYDAGKINSNLDRIFDTGLFSDLTFKPEDDPKAPGSVIVTLNFKEKAATP